MKIPQALSRLRKHWSRPILLGVLALSCVVTWLGYSYYQQRYPSWDEEVRLSDGRVITIHQKRQYYDNYGTNQSWVTIDLPELGGKQVWHSYLMPQRVDVVGGKVYVFGVPRGDRQLEYYRYPKYLMVGLTWDGSNFVRIPYLAVPESIRKEENVFPCVPHEAQLATRAVTTALKAKSWCPMRDASGRSSREIDLEEYKRFADDWASIPRWQDKNRSD